MITQQLIEYIRQRVIDGASREDITKELLTVGWSGGDLDKVFSAPEVMTARSTVKDISLSKVSPGVPSEMSRNEPSVDMYKDNRQNVPSESVSPIMTPSISQQMPASFVPPSSFTPASVTRDSFWYRPVIIILTLVILMGVVGGGVYAYYTYSKQPSAISVLRGVLEHAATIQSFDFAATSTSATATNIALSSLGAETGGMLGGAKFIYATTTVAQHGTIVLQKARTHPDIDLTTALQGAISVATTSGTYSLSLHTILSSRALDLKLLRGKVSIESVSPQLRMGPVFVNAALAKISDRWVRLVDFTNATSSQQFSKIFSDLSASSSPIIAKDLKDLRTYVDSLQYVHSARNVGIEYLNGVPTYHLSLVIQNTPQSVLLVQRFMYDYIHLLHTRDGAMGRNISFATFLQKGRGFNETFTQKLPINIWVGKNDSRVYKFTIPSITFVGVGNNLNSRATLREELRFANYNSTAPIVSPKNVESLKSFMSGLFGFGSGGGL